MTAGQQAPRPWEGEHPEEWLSAYADGELDPGARLVLAEHLAGCRGCRDLLADELAVRALVRDLPAVEPPAGFLDRVVVVGPAPRVREHRRTKVAAVNVVAAAALWVGILGLFGLASGSSVTPDLRSLLGLHTSLVGGGPPASTSAGASRPVAAPRSLAGDYVLVRAMTVGGWPQYLYEDDQGRSLSVFVRPGRLDVDALPTPRRAVVVNDVPGWAVTIDGQEVVFLQKPGSVVVLVGDVPADAPAEVAAQSSLDRSDDPGLLDHLVGAGRGLLQTFGLAS